MFDFWSIVRRFLYMLFVLWIVATIIFFMFRLMPGSPLTAFIGTTFTDEQHDLLVKRFGLDKSLFEQYTLFIVNTLKGDLIKNVFTTSTMGVSYKVKLGKSV